MDSPWPRNRVRSEAKDDAYPRRHRINEFAERSQNAHGVLPNGQGDDIELSSPSSWWAYCVLSPSPPI
jgi:hypothetical protein